LSGLARIDGKRRQISHCAIVARYFVDDLAQRIEVGGL